MIRVLVVDDSDAVRQMICRILYMHEEFRVVADASSADSAIEKARRHKPDVVLLDISMPGLNGLQAISLIKNAAPHTEILMVTQHNSKFVVREALSAGARGFLNKTDIVAEVYDAVIAVFLKNRFLSASVRNAECDSLVVLPTRNL